MIEPIPYIPQLCRVLGGVTIAIVFTYLEIHHSPPDVDPDAKTPHAGLRIAPVTLDCDQVCEDLGIARRTLDTALQSLGVWWGTEQKRSAAARSGRDFLNSVAAFPPSTLARIKPYAIVGSHVLRIPTTLTIHRNPDRISEILTDAGIITTPTEDQKVTPFAQISLYQRSTGSASDVLANVLGLVPVKRGIDWGWSQERAREHSARMTRLWAERRENGVVGGSTRRP